MLTAGGIRFVVGQREEVVIALDWTEFDGDNQATLAAYVVTSHGPLAWLTVKKSLLKGNRNTYEDRLITSTLQTGRDGFQAKWLH